MRILFMGTPDFALVSLRALCEAGEQVIGVVTQPDKPRGRGYVMTPPPVKVYAESRGIPVFQPQKLRDGSFDATLAELAPELIIVVAYGKILPLSILDFPKYGCINVHGSLLPEYRGAAPIQRAIIDGKRTTGVTTMYMADGVDTGDMLLRATLEIGEEDNFETVHDALAALGAEVLLDTLAELRRGTLKAIPQDGRCATYAGKIEKEDCVIDFSRGARELHDQIRGLSPFPLAFCHLPDGKLLKVTAAEIAEAAGTQDEAAERSAAGAQNENAKNGAAPGTVVALDGGIVVQCGSGKLRLLGVLPEGRGRMSAADLINGRRVAVGDVLA